MRGQLGGRKQMLWAAQKWVASEGSAAHQAPVKTPTPDWLSLSTLSFLLEDTLPFLLLFFLSFLDRSHYYVAPVGLELVM